MWSRSSSRSKVTGEESTDTQGGSARRLMHSSSRFGRGKSNVQTGDSPKKATKSVTVSEPLLEDEDEDNWAKHSYPQNKMRGDDDSSVRSGRSGRSGLSASSKGSKSSKASSSARSNRSDLTGISEDLPWRQGDSEYGDYRSDGGSKSSVRTRESDEEREEATPIILLQSSQPAQVGTIKGRYVMRVVRASLKQAFGITFDVAESISSSTALMVSEDLPHLGIRKGDELLSVNGSEPKSINEVRRVLQSSLSIVLVMQRRGVNCQVPPPKYKMALDALEPMDRLLLSATKVRITDLKRSEFKLSVHRNSQKQKFGLAFDASLSKSTTQELAILVSEDMPHLALARNDKLHMINNIRPRNRKVCAQILNSAMQVDLTFRARDPSRLKNLGHIVHPVEDLEEEEGGLEEGAGCCRVCEWCCGPNWAGPRDPEARSYKYEHDDAFEDSDDRRSENAYGMQPRGPPSRTVDAMGGSMQVDADDPLDCCSRLFGGDISHHDSPRGF